MSTLLRYQSYFHDAAKIALRIKPWREINDKEIEPYYVIDADVVVMFTNPTDTYSYARVFLDDPDESCGLLARKLGDYLFFKIAPEKSRKFLVFPPHRAEIKSMLWALQRSAAENGPLILSILDGQTKFINSAMVTLDKALISSDNASFSKALEFFIDIFIGNTNNQLIEFCRFGELINKEKLIFMQQNCSYTILSNADELNDIAKSYQAIYGLETFQTLKEEYFSLLAGSITRHSRTKSKKKRTAKTRVHCDRDADVLAAVELINSDLIKRGSNIRLFFITGSESIHKNAGRLISQQYLLHPIGLIDKIVDLKVDDVMFNDNPYTVNDFGDWIKFFLLCLSNYSRYGADFDVDFYAGCKRVLEGDLPIDDLTIKGLNGQFLDLLKHPWVEYIRMLTNRHWNETVYQSESYSLDAMSGGISDIKNIRLKALDIFKDHFNRNNGHVLIKQIMLREKISWDNFISSTAELNLPIIVRNKSDMPARCLPGLIFSDQRIQDIMNQLFVFTDCRDIYNKLLNIRGTTDFDSYYVCLGMALIYCYCDRWELGQIMAVKACEIIENINASQLNDIKNPNGSEAYYLLSVCQRINSSSIDDLINRHARNMNVEELINESEARSDSLVSIQSSFRERYAIQRISLNLTYHLYGYYLKDDLKKIPGIWSLIDIGNRIINSLGNIEESDDMINIITRRRLLANLASTCFLLRKKSDEIQTDEYCELRSRFNASRYLNDFKKVVLEGFAPNSGTKPWLSFRIMSLYLLAQTMWRDEVDEKEQIISGVKKYLNDIIIDEKSILPYDPTRYRDIRKYILQQLGIDGDSWYFVQDNCTK